MMAYRPRVSDGIEERDRAYRNDTRTDLPNNYETDVNIRYQAVKNGEQISG